MNNKIPPPVLMLGIAAVMWLVAHSPVSLRIPIAYAPILATVFIAAGLIIVILAIRQFSRVETTVNPLKPEEATSLVRSGIYRLSRNPMYLGIFCLLLGWGVKLESPTNLIMLALFIILITQWQIKPEEAALSKLFGKEYEEYCRSVRRWI